MSATEREAFGPHLIIDGHEADCALLGQMGHVYDFLKNLPDEIDMTKIMPPYVFKFHPQPPHPPEDAGISGFVIIAESHISIHTYPERGFLFIDIFSCKPFDFEKATAKAVSHFKIKRPEVHKLDRGMDFPKNTGLAMEVVRWQREGRRA